MDLRVYTLMTQLRSLLIRVGSNLLFIFRSFQYIEKKPGDKIDTVKDYKIN